MYHDVLPSTTSRGGGGERFAVPVRAFETMLDAIQSSGHAGCSVEQALRAEGPRVAISFDDGTKSQFDCAVPALLARDMTATFFVTTGWVGRPGFMSWSDLRSIASRGMSVQSHTRSHPFLSELDGEALAAELSESKAALDRELDQETVQISLPGGNAPRRRLRHLLGDSGYRIVAGSRWGINKDHFVENSDVLMRRCSMRSSISDAEALRVLAGDRWLSVTTYWREAALNGVRGTLGPSHYAKWRKRLLDTLNRDHPPQ